MKQIKSIIILAAMLLTPLVSTAQSKMTISFKDGTQQSFDVSTIDSITWEEAENVSSHEYVDLGLSVKWATCNIGATNPEDYGDYFAWGETEPKSYYSWSTYFDTTDNGRTFVKYNNNGGKNVLDPEDDAAHVNWGGDWRMSTDAEWTELQEKCTWTWTTQNGVNGYEVTGTNGNSIFLPAGGNRGNSNLNDAGSYGYYWSSSLNTGGSYFAYDLYFDSSSYYRDGSTRRNGQSIRPVCQ